MQGQRMKKFLLLPLVLATLELQQTASTSLPGHQSSNVPLSSRTNQLPTSGDITRSADDLDIAGGYHESAGDSFKVNDLASDEPRLRHLNPGEDESFEEFLRSYPGEDDDPESVAERTTRGYFNEPREINEDNLRPAERSSSSVHFPQHHGLADINDRGANTAITGFDLPQDASRSRSGGSKLTRDGDGGVTYNADRSDTYNADLSDTYNDDRSDTYTEDRSDTYNKDGGAVFNREPDAGRSRDGDGDSGFMGDGMHQSLMAKILDASAHAFDGADQHSRLEFGLPSGGSGEKAAEAAPVYKPVYEAPSRQPDPRPHAGQRPVPIQPDDESDYRLNGVDDSHRGGSEYHRGGVEYRDDKSRESQQPYDGQETDQGQDYRHQGDDQRKGTGRGQDYLGDEYRGEYFRGDGYKADDSTGGHKRDGNPGDDYQGGDLRDGDYRNGDYGAEEGRRGGYASFDPYKEAAQEEEAYRAVEGDTDRYGQYSRSQGGTRHPDRKHSTPYPSRYEESAMDRGYKGSGGYDGYQRDSHHRPEQELKNRRSGYHGNWDKRGGRHDSGDDERSGYYVNRDNEQSGFSGSHDNKRSGNQGNREVHNNNSREVHNNSNTAYAPERQKRDLGSPHQFVIVTEEVRSIHPVIHRHYEGIPPPTKGVPPLTKGILPQTKRIPGPAIGISRATAGIPQGNAWITPAMTIFREDIPPSSFFAGLAHLPSLDEGLPGIAEEAQNTVHVVPGEGQTVLGGTRTELHPEDGAEQRRRFTPGLIHTGFVPMTPAHYISKRSLNPHADGHVTSDGFLKVRLNRSSARSLEEYSNQAETNTSEVEGSQASATLPRKADGRFISGKLVISDDPVTSGDLLPAGSRHQAVYQPHYAGYDRQQGRQNAASEQDPYERYLPREDENDPYFRYAPRESIQHSHDLEQAVRTGKNSHEKYDLYGQPRKNSHLRRPQGEDDYTDYDDEDYHGDSRQDGGYPSYDDYEEDYASPPTRNPAKKRHPDYDYDDKSDSGYQGNGGLGSKRGNGRRYQDVGTSAKYEDDLFDDNENDQNQRIKDESRRREDNEGSGFPLRPVTQGGVQKFTPGVIQNGFVPITESPHHVSQRSLAHLSTQRGTSHSLEDTPRNTDVEQQEASIPAGHSSHENLASNSGDIKISEDTAVTSGDPVTSGDLVSSGNPVTSGRPVTSGDLLPAGSRHRAVYQPHYAGYGRQQGRQNAASEQDPYERYLPGEDENDPYFRYAPRKTIQHSHDQEQASRTGEKNHAKFDLSGTPRKSSHQRRPQLQEDYADYGNENYYEGKRQDSNHPSYDDYEEDYLNYPTRNSNKKRYPDYDYDQRDSGNLSNGRRGNRRGSGQRYQDDKRIQNYETDLAEEHEDDLVDDYEDNQKEDYEDNPRQEEYEDRNRRRGQQKRGYRNRPSSADYSGQYRDEAQEKQHGGGGEYLRHTYRDHKRRYRNGRPTIRKYIDEEDQGNPQRDHEDTHDPTGVYEDAHDTSGAYEDTRDASGAYEDNPRRAAGGFEDTRRAVGGMLSDMAQKKKDGSCKEVKRDGMSCLQCSDANGMQTEECAYAGEAPGNGHSGYSTSSSYGDPPRRQDGNRGV